MVCIAAFIILCLLSVIVGFLSLFKRDIGAKWWKVFKKAWYCVFQKVRLKKCDTNLKEDIKNSILKKFILKRPKLVKPISIAIEIISVVIVFITVWSIIIAIKSLLALWVFGTCNVSQPSKCGLGAEACTIDSAEPTNFIEYIGRDFSEWGEIFTAIPDRLKTWRVSDYLPQEIIRSTNKTDITALDLFDPGCSVCMQSFKNQKQDGSLDRTAILPYAIKLPDGQDKFSNSSLIIKYIYSVYLFEKQNNLASNHSFSLLQKIFTEFNSDKINFQTYLQILSESNLHQELNSWLVEFGFKKEQINVIKNNLDSQEVLGLINEARQIAEEKLRIKSIPTAIYDGKKHTGLYQVK